MIVVFVVDTSVSMNQVTSAGNMTVLDCAKALIEHFLKVRGRTQPQLMRTDRYFRNTPFTLLAHRLSDPSAKKKKSPPRPTRSTR